MSKSIRLFFTMKRRNYFFPSQNWILFSLIWHYAGLPSYREKSNNVLSAKRRCTLSPVSYKMTTMHHRKLYVVPSFYKFLQKVSKLRRYFSTWNEMYYEADFLCWRIEHGHGLKMKLYYGKFLG